MELAHIPYVRVWRRLYITNGDSLDAEPMYRHNNTAVLSLVPDVSCPCPQWSQWVLYYNCVTRAGTEWWSFTTGARAAAASRGSSVWCCSCPTCGPPSRRVSSGPTFRRPIRRPATPRWGNSTATRQLQRSRRRCRWSRRRCRRRRSQTLTPRQRTNQKLFVPSFVWLSFRLFYRVAPRLRARAATNIPMAWGCSRPESLAVSYTLLYSLPWN